MTLYYVSSDTKEKIFINNLEDFHDYADWLFWGESVTEEMYEILTDFKKKNNLKFLNVTTLESAIFRGTSTEIAENLNLITEENIEYFFSENTNEDEFFEEVKQDKGLDKFVSLYFIQEILNKFEVEYIWLFPNECDDTQDYNCLFLPQLLKQEISLLDSIVKELKELEKIYDNSKPIAKLIEKLKNDERFNSVCP